MVKEAEANAEDDKKRREEVEVRNQADTMVYTTEKTLKDLDGKIDQAEIDKANEAKEAVKKALESNNTEEIKAANEKLSEVVQQLSVKLYEQAAQAQQEGAANSDQAANAADDVVDADYEVVNEEEKK